MPWGWCRTDQDPQDPWCRRHQNKHWGHCSKLFQIALICNFSHFVKPICVICSNILTCCRLDSFLEDFGEASLPQYYIHGMISTQILAWVWFQPAASNHNEDSQDLDAPLLSCCPRQACSACAWSLHFLMYRKDPKGLSHGMVHAAPMQIRSSLRRGQLQLFEAGAPVRSSPAQSPLQISLGDDFTPPRRVRTQYTMYMIGSSLLPSYLLSSGISIDMHPNIGPLKTLHKRIQVHIKRFGNYMELSIWGSTQEIESTSCWWALAACTATFCGWHLPKARCVHGIVEIRRKDGLLLVFWVCWNFKGFFVLGYPGISGTRWNPVMKIASLIFTWPSLMSTAAAVKKKNTYRRLAQNMLLWYTVFILYTTLGVSVDSEGQHYVCCWYILIPSGSRWSPADCIQPTFVASSHHISPWQTFAPDGANGDFREACIS